MKQFEYSQQLEHLKMSIDDIKEVLDSKGVLYAGIIHDKDETAPHVHIMVKLNSDMTVGNVAKWFSDEPQYINIKRSRWENKLSYLIHDTETSGSKYQYDPSQVFSNFDYLKKLEGIQLEVEKKKNIDDIISLIQDGTIREYNLTDYVDAFVYSKYKNRLLYALEWYRRQVMTDKDRNINVIMISGSTGVGKTSYAKQYCKNMNKSFCVSSSSNDPLQDYKGEEVLILDDLRDDAFKFHDFLKLLDNHTKSTSASRYSNKAFIGDTIIITSSKAIGEWYQGVSYKDLKQLYRRVSIVMEMDNNFIHIKEYNEKSGSYDNVAKVENIFLKSFKDTKKRALEVIKGFGIELDDKVKDEIINYNNELNDKKFVDLLNEEDRKKVDEFTAGQVEELPF